MRTNPGHELTLPGDASALVAALGWCSVIVYAWLFFADAGTTWHSVDTIRDFHAASAIAHGTEFPVASQPWAARYQTPPAYLYLLALPIWLGANELDLMRIIGLIGLGAVGMLHRAIRPVFGADAANIYLTTSFTVSGALFAHSIGNSVLAMSASAMLLALLLRISVQPSTQLAAAMIVLAALLPQLHLSALPLATVTVVIGLVRYRSAFLRIGPTFLVLALALATGVWLKLVGGIAPEAESAPGLSRNLPDILLRIVDLQHWRSLLSTFVRFVDALKPAPSLSESYLITLRGLVLLFTVISVGAGSVGIWTLLTNRSVVRSGVARSLAAITVASFFCAGAYVENWGIWYFDSLWPWLSLCVAVGLARILTCIQSMLSKCAITHHLATAQLLLLLLLGFIVPPVIAQRALSRDGELAIDAGGLFFSDAPAVKGKSVLVQLSAANQLALRASLRELTNCRSSLAVGLFELYLRDFTLRDTWHGCTPPDDIDGVSRPFLVVRSIAPYREAVDWVTQTAAVHGGVRVISLPQQQAEIGASHAGQIQGQIPLRYAVFRSALIPANTPIRARRLSDDTMALRLRLALRCLAPVERPDGLFAAEPASPIVRPIQYESALGIHYYLLESYSAQSEFAYRTLTDINCDLMVYLVPNTLR